MFAISSSMAALGGIVLASRLSSVDTNAGGGSILLYSIAAPVIGGTSLFGGRGTIRSAILGAIVIASIDNGLGLTERVRGHEVHRDRPRAARRGDRRLAVAQGPHRLRTRLTRRWTLRWGLLSTARINTAILAGARTSDEVAVVAVGSRDQARAEAYAREHGIETAHGSYEALLEDPDVDAIYISLPNGPHVEWSIRALEAGKHVLCEKPLTRRAADAERAFDAADAAGLVLMEAFMWRHNPQTQTIAELVRDGAIGQLRLVRTAFSFSLDDAGRRAPGRGARRRRPDGPRVLLRQRRASPGRRTGARSGHAVTAADGVDRRFAATLRHDGDVLTTLDCGFDLPPRRGAAGDRDRGRAVHRRPVALLDVADRHPPPGRHRRDRSTVTAAGQLPARTGELRRGGPRDGASRCSGAPTRSGRHARSRRSTPQPPRTAAPRPSRTTGAP